MADENGSTNPFESDARQAAQQTNEQLTNAEARVAALSWDQLRKLLPDPLDQQQLTDLMNMVQADTDHNEKVASLIANISTLGSVVVKVLSRVPMG
ncbi:MAG TPA: hypothetical protein VJN92_19755 [Candidatus Acidoferrum sp.]|nr:hypothetical protein [Candidatus Acidoferrum sp.]